MFKYVKKAFYNHWNLLALGGGICASFLSGAPEIFLPVVLAAETAYLGFVGTHPKFQKFVDVEDHQSERAVQSKQNDQILKKIRRSLPKKLMNRFNRIRSRCHNLRRIAADLKDPNQRDFGSTLESEQNAGLDRLLWVFLRLLYTYHQLGSFLQNTSLEKMEEDKAKLEKRLAEIKEDDTSSRAIKLRRALKDNLDTIQERIDNYNRAEENFEFVELEINRLEHKIQSLAELAVNRQEPDFITDQVDEVAESMKQTEMTMNELQFATGLDRVEDEVPELMQDQPIYEIG